MVFRGFTGSYVVFTGSYVVLLGFTGFDWVAVSRIGSEKEAGGRMMAGRSGSISGPV